MSLLLMSGGVADISTTDQVFPSSIQLPEKITGNKKIPVGIVGIVLYIAITTQRLTHDSYFDV